MACFPLHPLSQQQGGHSAQQGHAVYTPAHGAQSAPLGNLRAAASGLELRAHFSERPP